VERARIDLLQRPDCKNHGTDQDRDQHALVSDTHQAIGLTLRLFAG
jgi:hypothetical protein